MGVRGDFDVAEVERGLSGTRFAGGLRHFRTVDSTNTDLMSAAAGGARDGTVYVADEQTAGRGRGGHQWHSAAGDGLYLSALVRPALPLARALWIALATGLAAKAAITQSVGLRADIRWPNDLLLSTASGQKKCGGILIETAADGEALRYAVIGVGINVNHVKLPAELAAIATSLRIEAGEAVARAGLAVRLLRTLHVELNALEAGGDELLTRFAAASSWVRGKRVQVAEGGGYTGLTAGLDDRGFLQVLGEDGVRRTVLSGGVREA